uniref:Uncharacterized protein n=1 Tax=Anguilla anguilla TaxID=7936 RepID=A0A0E9PUC7_ANGAN
MDFSSWIDSIYVSMLWCNCCSQSFQDTMMEGATPINP